MPKLILTLIITVVMLTSTLLGEIKIGFVQSDRIRAEYEEFRDAESQLQMEFRKVQMEYQIQLMELDSLKNAYETQRLMSSPEWRREKEQEIATKERNLQVFQAENVGPEGLLYQKQAQMEFEILSKVKRAVDKVAAEKEYDYIIDGSVSLLFGNPAFDVTDDILYELRKYNISEEDK
ncbi:MAG: OmpH family outer membrane protein [Candidatus Marinimicrobia bacterium]|nr:OmpH family outer membrane protein [Candidatus Neomarinimicrobiota bacterium]MDP6230227.1 OmpH family outer membrane protein [Candidatus Neomarinimicrobiota bacterium]MDP7095264.1 OmpH family outer membrane protein [Candidatus Neomarinimicrobiota bacterium]MDP7165751.1 OmpH family outer membrane protein [Candidatus Neomarinimicrobiota bacterium]MDP7513203.1 OmpH family outer membrane protein [Candidatus Neomarinimicrobiota bacterium]